MYLLAMTSLLSWLANVMGRRPRAATAAVLLAVVALIGGGIAAGGAFKDDFTVPGIESQTAQDLLAERFPAQSGTSATVVFSGDVDAKALAPTLETIDRQPHVVGVTDLQRSEDPELEAHDVTLPVTRRRPRHAGARRGRQVAPSDQLGSAGAPMRPTASVRSSVCSGQITTSPSSRSPTTGPSP